jgi:uncharacterized repeat protein (TIGR01451 family)
MAKEPAANSVSVGQSIMYRICIFNRSGIAQQIRFVTDTFPTAWSFVTCGGFLCAHDGSVTGGTVIWGQDFTIAAGADLILTVTGQYSAPGIQCNRIADYTLTFSDLSTLSGANDACVTVN